MTVPANSIVKTLDAIKHIHLSILHCRVDVALDLRLLQTAEERFGNRIDAPNRFPYGLCLAPIFFRRPKTEPLIEAAPLQH